MHLMFLSNLVTFAVTGASRGYAFVEYETEREMRHAYEVLIYVSQLKTPAKCCSTHTCIC